MIPPEIKPFIEIGISAIALEAADSNADGTKDYLLVREKSSADSKNDDEAKTKRQLLIFVRDSGGGGGSLKSAKRNEKVLYCRSCGGSTRRSVTENFDALLAPKKFNPRIRTSENSGKIDIADFRPEAIG